jgi:predicted TIM-barrel fold metal-dependent hydrolase
VYLENYDPITMLVTKQTLIKHSRFPVIDSHNHLDDEFGGGWIHKPIEEILQAMDEVNVRILVDMDGGWGEKILQNHLEILRDSLLERFQVFGGVNWEAWKTYGNHFPDWAAKRMREQAKWGATGLKIWKDLGSNVRDQNDQLVDINDKRLDMIWQTAAELHWPVMIHVGDPAAFFEPIDNRNERWEELITKPEWHIPSPPFPPLIKILDSFSSMVRRNRKTTFIGAHVGCYAENLAWVGKMLDNNPNYYIDISARIGELGRQPYSSRRFFHKYANQILFGLDYGIDKSLYQIAYRFLETDDEYFNYSSTSIPAQGRWAIYGIGLPEEVLRKVYYENACRVLNIPNPG